MEVDETEIEKSELEEIASLEDDVTEPACMDKILMYLDQLKIDDESFMQMLVDRLPDMIITWEQPWYQQTNCLTRPCRDSNENDSEKFLTDTISTRETKIIEKNWRKFRKTYNLPDMPICFARWKNKDKCRLPNTPEERARHFVTAFLARGLKRNLYQVYRHILTHYGSPVKGQYSKIEGRIIEICFYHAPSKAVPLLTLILGREPRGIYKRLHQLGNGNPDKKKPKMRWDLTKASEFVKSLVHHSMCPLEELKNKTIDKSVWLKVEEDMDIHYTYLQAFWIKGLHTQLFVKFDVKLNKLRRRILKKIRSYPYQVWGDIRWKEILKLFSDGFTHYFLYKVCHSIARNYPKYRKAPLEDVIMFCLNKTKTMHNKRLKTLALDENGNLKIVKYSERIEFT